MKPEEHKRHVRRLVDELWNNGNLDICEETFAPNCSFHDPSFPIDGVNGMKEQVRQLRAATPDLHVDVHDVLADGDLTCARWTMGGTSRGEFRNLPATGKTFVITGMTFDKWEGNRIVEEWTNYDLLGGLQQLGIAPELAQAQAQATPGQAGRGQAKATRGKAGR